jgi:hypothetical protein
MLSELDDYFNSVHHSVDEAKKKVLKNFKEIHQENGSVLII